MLSFLQIILILITIIFLSLNCGKKQDKNPEGSGLETCKDKHNKNGKSKRKRDSSLPESKRKQSERGTAPTSNKIAPEKIPAPNTPTPQPKEKPLNEKEMKILYGHTRADENEYPTMQDAQDGFKDTPTIETGGAKL
uniref:Uncharacterized protein n=1 Tax=Parastrongyloides trichosuri TaxID=131310 RepID=A0A0N4ZK10_PARTI